ncbi:MAG: winged helix-turn-helix domain-containing protein [Acidobacteriota bacterium]
MTEFSDSDLQVSDGFQLGSWSVRPAAGSMLRQQQRVALSPRQMGLLLYFAERPGALLEKEELLAAVWCGAAVEDGALPRCISELRRLLEDSAQNPAYIETVPRRGYRLIAAVTPLPEAPASSEPTAHAPRKPWAFAAASGLLFCALFTASAHDRANGPRSGGRETEPRPQRRSSVAVLDFDNLTPSTTHGWLSDALSETLAAELAASPALRVVQADALAEPAGSPAGSSPGAGRPGGSEGAGDSEAEATRERLRTLSVDFVVYGSYLAPDDAPESALRLDVWVEDVASGHTLAVLTEVRSISQVLQTLSLMGARQRSRLDQGGDGGSAEAPAAGAPEAPGSARGAGEEEIAARSPDRLGVSRRPTAEPRRTDPGCTAGGLAARGSG